MGWRWNVFQEYANNRNVVAAVKQNGRALHFIPEDERTPELSAAVEQVASALEDVPEDKLSQELYLAAVKQNPLALKEVPKQYRNILLIRLPLPLYWQLIIRPLNILLS